MPESTRPMATDWTAISEVQILRHAPTAEQPTSFATLS
jgi:hypothetical protein